MPAGGSHSDNPNLTHTCMNADGKVSILSLYYLYLYLCISVFRGSHSDNPNLTHTCMNAEFLSYQFVICICICVLVYLGDLTQTTTI